MNLLVGIMLAVCAIEDWYTKKISVLWPAAGLAIAVGIRLQEGSFMDWDYWIGAMVGMFFFLLAIVSREQIGKGDGLVLTVCGFCLGWRALLSLVLGAMILFLAAGVVNVFRKKKKRDTAMAYLPFLWIMFMTSRII